MIPLLTSEETEAHRDGIICPENKWQSQDSSGFLRSLHGDTLS